MWLWYVAPTIVGIELMTLRALGSAGPHAGGDEGDRPRRRRAIHRLNVVTARHELMPLRAELEQHIDELSR